MEIGIKDVGLFILSGLILNMMPGPDSLLVMTRSAVQGWRAGVVAAMGIGAGILVHVLVAALGLSALLAASPAAFALIKCGGAAYIVIMGLLMLRRGLPVDAGALLLKPSHGTIFLQGFLTDVLNPKVALFFLAFVPQFIEANAASKPLAFFVLGLLFDINCMLCFCALALGTASASARLGKKSGLGVLLKRLAGGAFVFLGIRLALN
jgi:threonine/homoserine/homoserine lactone efflux protein